MILRKYQSRLNNCLFLASICTRSTFVISCKLSNRALKCRCSITSGISFCLRFSGLNRFQKFNLVCTWNLWISAASKCSRVFAYALCTWVELPLLSARRFWLYLWTPLHVLRRNNLERSWSLLRLLGLPNRCLGPSPLLLPYLIIAPSNSGEPNISQKPSTFLRNQAHFSDTKHLPFLSNIFNSKPKEYNISRMKIMML